METTIRDNLTNILTRIQSVALRCGRKPEEIRLVAVGKTHPAGTIRSAIAAGATIIGENYIQEARDKFDALIHETVQWHFIGHLQTKKAKYAVRMFDLIHTVDSLKLATELDRCALKAGKIQDVLIQVNISGETTKSGGSPEEAPEIIAQTDALPNLRVRGLMTIPPFFDDPDKARPCFAALRKLRDQVMSQKLPGLDLQELSMGMSGDFEAAIEEGATLVRIGTAIFGERA